MKNLSYYQKIGFKDPFSWTEEDFSNFLIGDQVEAVKYEGDLWIPLLNNEKKASQKYDKYKFILNVCDIFFQKMCFRGRKNKKRILFQTIRYPSLILKIKKHYNIGLIAEGKKDRLFSLKSFIGYFSVNDLHKYVYGYLKEKKIDYLYQLVLKLEKKILRLKPDYVVLWDDNLPFERAIVLVCKKNNIPVIEIQHGIYQSSLPLTTGKMVDYLFVWGKYFKDLYVNRGIRKPENVYVLGCPYKFHKIKSKEKKKCVVYYLGQNIEAYNKGLLALKIETLKKLNQICKELNIDFFYRPHPTNDRELTKSKIPEVNFVSQEENIFDTISNGDIFISFSSSSLIQAAMQSKITLQLINYPLAVDNFEKLGICTKSFKEFNQIKEYLQEITRNNNLNKVNFEFNDYYIETKYDLEQRFIDILNQINKKEKI